MNNDRNIDMNSAVSQEFLRIANFIASFSVNLYDNSKLHVIIHKTVPFQLEIYSGDFLGFNLPPYHFPFIFFRNDKQACQLLMKKVEDLLIAQNFKVVFEDTFENSVTYEKYFYGINHFKDGGSK